tara:strand:+ start:92 stop:532 length:441 start_codon:yes stop_codon:yes gene_type:complete
MRATISFDIDVDQVENTMAAVMSMEADNLRAIADMIDVSPGARTSVLKEITEALDSLTTTTAQLQQYRDMLLSFEKAKFQTMLPQELEGENHSPPASLPTDELRRLQERSRDMVEFNRFLGGINSASRDAEFKKLDESPPAKEEEE